MLNILKIIVVIIAVISIFFVSLFVFCVGLLSNIINEKENEEDKK